MRSNLILVLSQLFTLSAFAAEPVTYQFRCERPTRVRSTGDRLVLRTVDRVDFTSDSGGVISDERSYGAREFKVRVTGKARTRAAVEDLARHVESTAMGFGSADDQLCRVTRLSGRTKSVRYFISYGTNGDHALSWKVFLESRRELPDLF